jgi:hypothetical protein
VFRAAHGSWREYWLGFPTPLTIIANTVLPGYLDHYLARTAVAGQQTKTPLPPARRDNLDHPVGYLHRTRGSFTAEAGTHAMLVPGPAARLGVVAAGALLFFGLGALWRVVRPAIAKPSRGRLR